MENQNTSPVTSRVPAPSQPLLTATGKFFQVVSEAAQRADQIWRMEQIVRIGRLWHAKMEDPLHNRPSSKQLWLLSYMTMFLFNEKQNNTMLSS